MVRHVVHTFQIGRHKIRSASKPQLWRWPIRHNHNGVPARHIILVGGEINAQVTTHYIVVVNAIRWLRNRVKTSNAEVYKDVFSTEFKMFREYQILRVIHYRRMEDHNPKLFFCRAFSKLVFFIGLPALSLSHVSVIPLLILNESIESRIQGILACRINIV